MLLKSIPHFDCVKFVRFAVRISLKKLVVCINNLNVVTTAEVFDLENKGAWNLFAHLRR